MGPQGQMAAALAGLAFWPCVAWVVAPPSCSPLQEDTPLKEPCGGASVAPEVAQIEAAVFERRGRHPCTQIVAIPFLVPAREACRAQFGCPVEQSAPEVFAFPLDAVLPV